MKYLLLIGALIISAGVSAQTVQPYAGMQTRPIKSLSEQQIADLREGRGMGLAMAAELNGYPGPAHVLELGDRLNLSAAQRDLVQKLFAAMKAEAVRLGELLIAREEELDRQFADKVVTPAILTAATQAIGETQGALRAAHLKYHLSTLELLTAEQVRQYSVLRGYADGAPAPHQHRRH